jgi:hypothetical protein
VCSSLEPNNVASEQELYGVLTQRDAGRDAAG